ncbi:RNA-binding protein 6 [Protopterus annectens]|uniref:RNA-binding protein 6 n=1 Tax=Protopterus annectens TaxID=7888 RepID=UPI001CF944B4|nr:RNA-binding protein 6 [Protopterus annectens]
MLSPGYSHGFAYVEFSHLEEAVRCMEANQKNLTICGKRVSMRYSDPPVEWTCKYCEKINGPNRERCTNCDTKKSEALAGHSSAESSRHSKGHDRRQESERETAKKPSKQSESQQESKSSSKSEKESWHRTSTPPRHSPVRETQSPTSTRATSQHTSETAEDPSKSIIIKNISQSTTVNTILKALDPYAYLVKENIRIITSKRSGGNRGYAFVEMDSPKEAEHLVSILQKMNSAFTIAGRVVSVEVAKSSRRAPSSTVPDETYADEAASTSQTRKDKQGSPQHTSNKAATRKSSPEVDRSSSPIGPEDATYLYDATSGFYYDPRTGLYFDPKSEYHYDAEKKQYLTWDAEEKKYIPVPNESEEEPKAKKSSPSRTRRRSSSPRSGKRSSSPRGRRRSSSPRGRRRSASPRAGRSTSPRTSDTASPRTRDTTSPRGKREKKNSSQDKRASTRPERTKSAERERRENRERKDLKTLQEQQVARDLERWASALEKQKPATRTSPRASRLEADDTKELKDFDDVFVKPERPISVPPSANKRDDLFKKPPTPPPPPPPPTPVTILVKKKKKNQAELKQKTSSFINLLAEYGSGSEEEEEEEEEEVEVVVEEVTPPVVPQPVTQQKQQNLPEQQTVPKQQPQPQKHGDDEKLTDWEKLACLLCRRQFPTKEGLIRHQQLSDLHKQNLAIHCQIKMSQQELEYLEQKEREVKGKKRPALKKERALETASLAPTEKKRVKYASDMEEEIWPSDVGRSGEGKQFGTGSTSEGKAGGAKGRSGTASSYRDAVRKAMFARFKELD